MTALMLHLPLSTFYTKCCIHLFTHTFIYRWKGLLCRVPVWEVGCMWHTKEIKKIIQQRPFHFIYWVHPVEAVVDSTACLSAHSSRTDKRFDPMPSRIPVSAGNSLLTRNGLCVAVFVKTCFSPVPPLSTDPMNEPATKLLTKKQKNAHLVIWLKKYWRGH